MIYGAIGLLVVATLLVLLQLVDTALLLKGIPLTLIFFCGYGEEWLIPLILKAGLLAGWLGMEEVEVKGIGRKIKKSVIIATDSPPPEWGKDVYDWILESGGVDVDYLRKYSQELLSLHRNVVLLVRRPILPRRSIVFLLVLVLGGISVGLAYHVLWVWVWTGILVALAFALWVFKPRVKIGSQVLDCRALVGDESLAPLVAVVRGLIRDGKT